MNWGSDEVLAQILERGTIAEWREVYRRAEVDSLLRQRLSQLVLTVPLPLPRFWLAALGNLGADVDVAASVPDYYTATSDV
jgi:hypothetical protein